MAHGLPPASHGLVLTGPRFKILPEPFDHGLGVAPLTLDRAEGGLLHVHEASVPLDPGVGSGAPEFLSEGHDANQRTQRL